SMRPLPPTAYRLRQCEHKHLTAASGFELGRQGHHAARDERRTRAHGDVLLAAHGERDWVATHGRAEVHLPQHLTGLVVDGAEESFGVTNEDQASSCRDQSEGASALLVLPYRLTGLGRDRMHDADL